MNLALNNLQRLICPKHKQPTNLYYRDCPNITWTGIANTQVLSNNIIYKNYLYN